MKGARQKEESSEITPQMAKERMEEIDEEVEEQAQPQKNMVRRVACVLYGAYALLQVFLSVYYLQGASFFAIPITAQIELLLGVGAAGMCVWLFTSDDETPTALRRGVIAFTLLVVLFELFTYQIQSTLLADNVMRLSEYALYLEQNFYYNMMKFMAQPIWRFVMILVRMLILILGAFFITGPDTSKMEGVEEDEDEDESEEDTEEVEDSEEEDEAQEAPQPEKPGKAPVTTAKRKK